MVRRGNEFRLDYAVLPPPSRLGGVRPRRNLRVFYSSKLWVCRGGRVFPALAVRHDVTSSGREIRCSTLQGRFGGGGFDSANLKTNKDAFGVCFLFVLSVLSIKHRALLNPPRYDMALSSVMGCLAQGMYLYLPFLCICPFCECKTCMVLQAAAEIEAGNFVTCTDSSFCTIVYAHLCYNRELFQPCRTIIAPRHAGAALFIPSPKKPLYLTSALIVDLENMRVDCWTLLRLE